VTRRRLGAAALGGATFVAGLSLSFGLASDGEAEADAPAPAGALAHVARMNAEANQMAAERIRREGASAL
jgi:hypothetical protein